jgi:hypothetical protein
MTSAINPSTISTTFPVAGQDNDSQGFRSNFAAIQTNFTTAENEITALQTVAIVKADLATQSEPVVNNLLGSTLSNGLYQQFSGTLYSASGVSSTANIDLSVGAVQKFTISGNATLTFVNWPAYSGTSVFASAVVLISSDTNGVWTPTLATSNGAIKYDVNFPASLSVGGESVSTISMTNAGSGYTSPVSIGFSGGNPLPNYRLPTATPTYTIVSASVANLAASSITTTGASGTGNAVTFTFDSQPVAPFSSGQSIVISGVSPSAYNGVWVVNTCAVNNVVVSSPAQGSYTSAGTIQGGVSGSGYAVGDTVKVVGYNDTYLTVATLSTSFPAQITGGQRDIGNIPAVYYPVVSGWVGLTLSGASVATGATINSVGSVSGGYFSVNMSLAATGGVQQTTIISVTNATTGPIGTFTGVPCGAFPAPLSGKLYQLETITGTGTGARPVVSCGISALTITDPGDGYTSTAPNIAITSGGGVNAAAQAVLTSGTASMTKVIEAWTVNAGTTVNVRYLGQY